MAMHVSFAIEPLKLLCRSIWSENDGAPIQYRLHYLEVHPDGLVSISPFEKELASTRFFDGSAMIIPPADSTEISQTVMAIVKNAIAGNSATDEDTRYNQGDIVFNIVKSLAGECLLTHAGTQASVLLVKNSSTPYPIGHRKSR